MPRTSDGRLRCASGDAATVYISDGQRPRHPSAFPRASSRALLAPSACPNEAGLAKIAACPGGPPLKGQPGLRLAWPSRGYQCRPRDATNSAINWLYCSTLLGRRKVSRAAAWAPPIIFRRLNGERESCRRCCHTGAALFCLPSTGLSTIAHNRNLQYEPVGVRARVGPDVTLISSCFV